MFGGYANAVIFKTDFYQLSHSIRVDANPGMHPWSYELDPVT